MINKVQTVRQLTVINNGNSIIQKLKSDYRLITFQGTKKNFLPPNPIIVSINNPIAHVPNY